MLAGAPEISAARTWTGLADTGRVALSHPGDTVDAAIRIVGDPSTWGQHHELTGPRQVTWPEALQVLSGELGETVTFRTTSAFELLQNLLKAGVTPGMTELLITREWAIMAGENERTTTTVRDLTGHDPRTIEEFLHGNRDSFR
jgi:NAD(P)H dehydrogenase (quinone)